MLVDLENYEKCFLAKVVDTLYHVLCIEILLENIFFHNYIYNFQAIQKYCTETTGVFVMSMSDYVRGFWPNSTEAVDLMESLSSLDNDEDFNIGIILILISKVQLYWMLKILT